MAFKPAFQDTGGGEGGSGEGLTPAQESKLNSVQFEATKNQTDDYLLSRENHTGTQPISTVEGLDAALDGKVDKVDGFGLSQANYTLDEKDKLNGIADEATKNLPDATLLARENHTGTQGMATVEGLDAALDTKVDKVTGKGLSDTNYTQAEKDKLAGLESSRFKGQFTSVAALEAALPIGEAGDYANVDLGAGNDVVRYVWDTSDEVWVEQLGVSSQLTAAQIKQEYESNPDTNSFSDDEKQKLATAVENTDPRLSDSREWTATTVSQAEAEEGTTNTRRAWTAQRVWQAIYAQWQGVTSTLGRTLVSRATAAEMREDLELGNIATKDQEDFGFEFEPSVQPTISSDFSKNEHKLYEQYGLEPKTILQQWDVTRASTATYVDATGKIRTAGVNEPRIDFSSGQGRLLVEEARTNLLTWSEDFSNASYHKQGVTVTPNTTIAPDAALTADRIVEDTSTDFHLTSKYVTFTGLHCGSVFVSKSSTKTAAQVQLWNSIDANLQRINFIPQTGEITDQIGSGTAWIEDYGNYFRVVLTGTSTTSSSALRIFLGSGDSYTGDGVSYLDVWGAQLEAASTPSSYIPTEDSQVTRAADSVSRVMGDEFNPEDFSVYMEFYSTITPRNDKAVRLKQDNINSFDIRTRNTASTYSWYHETTINNVLGNMVRVFDTPPPIGAPTKLVLSLSNGVISLTKNGLRQEITPSGTLPIPTELEILGLNYFTDRVKIYPKALSEQEAIELTKV